MISGNSAQAPPYGSAEQQAVSFLCLDFNGVSTKHDFLPTGPCPSGVRAQLVSSACMSLPNRSSHLLSPRTSKAAGTEKTSILPITTLTSLIALEDPTAVTALLTSL